MSYEAKYPPSVVRLPDWDNGAGVAVRCGGGQHRVVRSGDRVMSPDHPEFQLNVEEANSALARGTVKRLGFRFVETKFLVDDLFRWRGETWISAGPATQGVELGQVTDAAGLDPCVRLALEGFVPCSWCGRLLASGDNCTPQDNALCVLSNGTGWRSTIPAGWVQATLCGVPIGLSRSWPSEYAWSRNGPTSHVRQNFLASPWWPELHPRRLKNMVCQYASDQQVAFRTAFDAVATRICDSLGEMRPPP